MTKRIAGPIMLLGLFLSGCSMTYTAQDYPLTEDRISDFAVRGDVTVQGAYDEPHPVKVGNMNADLKQISDQMAAQMNSEIQRRHEGASGSDKTIRVRITRMAVVNRFAYNEGQINVELSLGNGETVSYEKRNGSAGNLDRVLNGTVARAIMEGLEHDKVRAYLAR